MVGQRTGPRFAYLYESDEPDTYYILQADETLAGLAGVGPGNSGATLFDPVNTPGSLPATANICPAPKRFTPRTVYAQSATDGARKSLICFSPTSDLYVQTYSTPVPALDGDSTFRTTGRRGEQLTYLKGV